MRRIGAVCLLAVLGAACSGDDEGAGTAPAADRGTDEAASAADSGFGPCDEVTIEDFQQIFGDRFAATKAGGIAADCSVVARDTHVGEALAIRDTARAGYGEDYATARSTAEADRFCPESVSDVDGIGDRAFYVATCDPMERPNESLHVELDGSHLSYSAYFIPEDRIASAREALTALARRLLG
jgi:hypothetical protein